MGCGVGHWGQRLLQHMDPTATLVGIDAEAAWISGAGDRAAARGLEARARYQVAHAQSLPWSDGSFDMVTCQTVLMHVTDPEAVVREMVRVLRPGGLFVAVEPNNFGSAAGQLVAGARLPWSEVAEILELEYTSALGKEALGEGWYAIGETLPGYLHSCGWSEIHVHQNNKCASKVPPYEDPGARVEIQLMRDSLAAGALMAAGGTPENARRYFLAGGGDASRFEELMDRVRAHEVAVLAEIDRGALACAGSHMHVLVWGHKPPTDSGRAP